MTTRYEYKNVKVNISDYQKSKLKEAINSGKSVAIQLKFTDLTGNDVLALTQGQIDSMARALEKNMGVRINMSKTQVEYNKKIEGGFLGALLSAALPAVVGAVAPDVLSWIWGKIRGNGLYISKNGGVIKVKQLGSGLFLSPYTKGKITGEGLFLKPINGGEYEKSDVDINEFDVFKLLTNK